MIFREYRLIFSLVSITIFINVRNSSSRLIAGEVHPDYHEEGFKVYDIRRIVLDKKNGKLTLYLQDSEEVKIEVEPIQGLIPTATELAMLTRVGLNEEDIHQS